jgi:hypothetical protein
VLIRHSIRQLNSETTPKDSVEFHINAGIAGSFYFFTVRDGQTVPDPVWVPATNNPGLAFHNYTIHYFPDSVSCYVDDILLGSNDVTNYGPSRPLALRLYVKAQSGSDAPALIADAAFVSAVSYQITNVTPGVCV